MQHNLSEGSVTRVMLVFAYLLAYFSPKKERRLTAALSA